MPLTMIATTHTTSDSISINRNQICGCLVNGGPYNLSRFQLFEAELYMHISKWVYDLRHATYLLDHSSLRASLPEAGGLQHSIETVNTRSSLANAGLAYLYAQRGPTSVHRTIHWIRG